MKLLDFALTAQPPRLGSRYATSLEQARKAVAYWQTEFHVAAEDVPDHSMIDSDDIFLWLGVDSGNQRTGESW